MNEAQEQKSEVRTLSLEEGMNMSKPKREHVPLNGMNQYVLSEIECVEMDDNYAKADEEDEDTPTPKKIQLIFKYHLCSNPAAEIRQFFTATNSDRGNLYKHIKSLGVKVTEEIRTDKDAWLKTVLSLKGRQYLITSEETMSQKGRPYNKVLNVVQAPQEVPVAAAQAPAQPHGDALNGAMNHGSDDVTFESDDVPF